MKKGHEEPSLMDEIATLQSKVRDLEEENQALQLEVSEKTSALKYAEVRSNHREIRNVRCCYHALAC